jgi:chromosome segregation ATPase
MTEESRDARIEELQATVDGLTSELLDLQERVRELEAEHGKAETEQSVEAMFANADDEDDDTDRETIGDDIIVG